MKFCQMEGERRWGEGKGSCAHCAFRGVFVLAWCHFVVAVENFEEASKK